MTSLSDMTVLYLHCEIEIGSIGEDTGQSTFAERFTDMALDRCPNLERLGLFMMRNYPRLLSGRWKSLKELFFFFGGPAYLESFLDFMLAHPTLEHLSYRGHSSMIPGGHIPNLRTICGPGDENAFEPSPNSELRVVRVLHADSPKSMDLFERCLTLHSVHATAMTELRYAGYDARIFPHIERLYIANEVSLAARHPFWVSRCTWVLLICVQLD